MVGGRYGAAVASLREDVILVEWDLAFEPDLVERFERAISQDPRKVRVAAYRLWPRSTGWSHPVWAHRLEPEPGRWVEEGEPECDRASFGMIYLPGRILRAARDARALDSVYPDTDTVFSRWHRRAIGRIPIAWDCRPVHVHW